MVPTCIGSQRAFNLQLINTDMTTGKKPVLVPGLQFGPDGSLTLTASATSSARDFDFLKESRQVHHRKLLERLTNCDDWFEFSGGYEFKLILNGLGNIEKYVMTANDGASFEGMNLRLFNPQTRLWSIYWADSVFGQLETPLVGSFEDGVGHFYTFDQCGDQKVLIQFRYDGTEKEKPNWRQGFSTDYGQTWEWNWYMNYR